MKRNRNRKIGKCFFLIHKHKRVGMCAQTEANSVANSISARPLPYPEKCLLYLFVVVVVVIVIVIVLEA